MPFVQDAAPSTAPTAATEVTQEATGTQASATQSTSPSVPVAPTTVTPQASAAEIPSTEVASQVKPSVAETKSDIKTEVKPAVKADSEPTVTITKSETVTTQLPPKQPSDSIWLFTWLPLVIMMGLWLYLRGRNQAAERARADALLATASKKSRKPARSGAVNTEGVSGADSHVASDRVGKGNSKKNKKDKQQQKKKQQQANSVATTGKAKQVNASANPASTLADSSANRIGATKTISEKIATSSPSIAAQASTATESAIERKTTVPATQPAKAIFEPLRKVTLSAQKPNDAANSDEDEGEEQDFTVRRKRRPSPQPQVITTPAKVSSGRFEKLNLPPANAGLNASSANRWPSEAARPVTPNRVPQQTASSRANSTSVAESAKPVPPTPVTGRGLGSFVKLAKPSATEDSTAVDSAEVQNESSGT